MTPIRHLDIPAEDSEALRAFYAGVFGWSWYACCLDPERNYFVIREDAG